MSEEKSFTAAALDRVQQEQELAEIKAGDAFRESIISRASDGSAYAPSWRGWAIMDAFRAGAKWQREHLSPLAHVHAVHIDKESGMLTNKEFDKLKHSVLLSGEVLMTPAQYNAKMNASVGSSIPLYVFTRSSAENKSQEEVRITSSKVAVDPDYHWQPMSTCPLHTKVQLLSKAGLPSYGNWDGKDTFYVGWQLVPTRAPT